MVANPASVLLDVKKDKVYGQPKPADPSGTRLASANLVANAALGSISDITLATVAAAETAGVDAKKTTAKDISLTVIPASPTR
jgi:hypothetical protein